MSDQSATVTVDNLPIIVYQNTRVITTELLAQVYGTEPKNLRMNYANNESRFELGKHYFQLEGEALRGFKQLHRANIIGSVEISPRVNSLMLYTERGAARHAKILDTDEAWEVFEKLEDAYFAPKASPRAEPPPATLDTAVMQLPVARYLDLVNAENGLLKSENALLKSENARLEQQCTAAPVMAQPLPSRFQAQRAGGRGRAKVGVHVRMSGWIYDWLRGQPQTQIELIENALIEHYGLEPPL